MIEVLQQLSRPRLVLAVIVVLCAARALLDGRVTAGEWGAVTGAAMWWTSGGANGVTKAGGPL